MKDFQSVINNLINKSVVGCDTYTNNNSLWLIFTDKKEWVIELTISGSLWYNYYFFQKIFKVLGLDVIEHQVYITKWVEDAIINGVRHIMWSNDDDDVEDAIQNGVRYTDMMASENILNIEDAIQNGVKNTHTRQLHQPLIVEDAIQNGVKETNHVDVMKFFEEKMEGTIQNGVKFVSSLSHYPSAVIEHTIENGVNHTIPDSQRRGWPIIEETIENGVKYTGGLGKTKWLIKKIKDTIQNGIKNNQII
jgi:hypothetical protein